MNVNLLSDEELVREIAGRCVTDPAAVDLAKFIRQCVKDSMPSKKEIIKILDQTMSRNCGTWTLLQLANALRKAMEGECTKKN